MTIHKEGYTTILIVFVLCTTISVTLFLTTGSVIAWPVTALLFLFCVFIVSFFRIPAREFQINENHIIAPADGTIVVIEETQETEYFNEKRLMVSIFMSPLNVHVNLYPVSGIIKYFKYHKGKFLVASLPKAAEENERTTTVLEAENGKQILIRQVAGAVARRIVAYVKEQEQVEQGEELGFIKFGSRVDLYLPLDAKVNVDMDEKVRGKQSVIATW